MRRIHHKTKNFFDRLPKLNRHSRKAIAFALPWIALGLGIMQLISAVVLYNLIGSVKSPETLNAALEEYYNGSMGALTAFDTAVIYACIGALAISAALFLGAVNGLRARRRAAWRMVLAALVFDFLYGAGQIFIHGRTWGNVAVSVLESAVLLFFLAQVHEHYVSRRRGQAHAQHPHNQHGHPAHAAHAPAHPHTQHQQHPNHNPHIHVG